jgi:hypothetical protein
MKYSLNTYAAATCLLLVVLSMESAAGAVTGKRKETCRLLNKADSFVELSDDSSTCVSDCTGNRAECKCKEFGLPTKVSFFTSSSIFNILTSTVCYGIRYIAFYKCSIY